MKFNCGKKSYAEYIARKTAKLQKRANEIELEHHLLVVDGEVIFALLPKTLTDGTCVWLERVRRKCICSELSLRYNLLRHRETWAYTAL